MTVRYVRHQSTGSKRAGVNATWAASTAALTSASLPTCTEPSVWCRVDGPLVAKLKLRITRLDPATVFDPSANRSQYKSVLEHLESAKAEGARVATGGKPTQLNGELTDGLFIQPTVLADVTPDMRVAREEIFGPAITILKYSDIDEAISLANNTEFGLGGIVFRSDQQRAPEVAEAMNTGSVGLNFFASNHAAPFGGRNDSGLGVEYGPEGLAAYLSCKSIHRH